MTPVEGHASAWPEQPLADWPALVMTAGLGTRLRPLSHARAKGALPVGGEVLVRRVLRWLRAAGIRRIVLNLHHLPDTITPYVGDGRDLDVEVRYSWESRVLGSAGGPARALPLLDAERFLIVNGDTLTDASLQELTTQHMASGAQVTMTVSPGDIRYGGVMTDNTGIVHGFARAGETSIAPAPAFARAQAPKAPAPQASASARKGVDASYGETSPKRPGGREGGPSVPQAPYVRHHFVGIQAVERRVFARVSPNELSESVWGLYPHLIADAPGSVRVYRTPAVFHDIGTAADYLATSRRFAAGAPEIGRDVQIHPSARVTGSILWDRVTIGAGAELVDCIVADDVAIPAGARFERQAIVMQHGRVVAADI